jgi:adenylate cyclase
LTPVRKRLLRWLGVVVTATALAFGLARTEFHESLENLYYDYWHVFSGQRYAPQYTAFITVDDATLSAYKDDPLAFWAPYWGEAISVLRKAGVKVVGLDFIYTVSAEDWLRKLNLPDSTISREYDTPLRSALAQGNTILITHIVDLPDGTVDLLQPPADQKLLLPGGIHDLGIANLHPDADKHIRSFIPVMVPDPSFPGLAFNMQLALRAANADPAAMAWRIGNTDIQREPARYRVSYAGPSGTIPTVSMLTLLKPDALERPEVKALAGKVAIIAANNAGTSDRHFTPYSRGAYADQMAGGEIHANIVETILGGRYPRTLPLWLEVVYIAVLVALATWFLLAWSVGGGAALGIALLIAVAPPAFFAFQQNFVLPVAEPQAALVLAFLMTLGLRLTGEEKEKSRVRQIFGRYVSDEVVDVLLDDQNRPDLSGEAKMVTVLFSDIRGFTTFSEKLSAHEVVELLNAYFTRACAPILAEGGMVNKFIGDAVMAVFGSPVSYPDHARRALRAAIGMAKEAAEFKQWMAQRFPDRGLAEFGIGVGLYTGEAVIGDIGTPKRKEFTAIGDTVNAASRLEGVTKELKIVIAASESTVKAAGEGVRTGKMEILTVKGRSEPIRVYEIVAIEGP